MSHDSSHTVFIDFISCSVPQARHVHGVAVKPLYVDAFVVHDVTIETVIVPEKQGTSDNV